MIGLTLILVALHLIKLLFALDGQLHPDEAYYWAWSQKPALSYYDQGPGIAYYIWIWTAIFGDHFITLKTAALAASGATILLFSLAGLLIPGSRISAVGPRAKGGLIQALQRRSLG